MRYNAAVYYCDSAGRFCHAGTVLVDAPSRPAAKAEAIEELGDALPDNATGPLVVSLTPDGTIDSVPEA